MSGPRLTRKLELEMPMQSADGAGGYQTDWAHLGTVWGAVAPRSGRFVRSPGGAVSLADYTVTLRNAQGAYNRPQAGYRFRLGGRVLRIEAVSEAKAGPKYLTCRCAEEVAP